jgi:hypothetical protein
MFPTAALLAHVSSEYNNKLSSDLRLIGKDVDAGVVSSWATAASSTWAQRLYVSLGKDEFLSCGTDPLTISPNATATGKLPPVKGKSDLEL